MPFDLYAIQKSIETSLATQFPNYDFYRSTVPEDKQVPRQGEEVNPFFVLQFGKMYPSRRGKSMKGARNDEYNSWAEIIGMGSVEDDVSNALSLPVDYLIGFKPTGATALIPDGGVGDYGSRQYAVRPVLYYMSQRFTFTLKQTGLDGHLSS
jgi:hypothetical protein